MVASKFHKFSRDFGIISHANLNPGGQLTTPGSSHPRNPITRVQLDLLFIEAQKRANTTGGITFLQFLEVLIQLAKKMYKPGNGKLYGRDVHTHPDEDLKFFLERKYSKRT